MIYISEEQLKQVEYLITQSIRGNHVLFDIDTIRRVMWKDHRLSIEDSYSVEHHIERVMAQSTIEAKRAYLAQLDARTYEWVVQTYFNIVENNLYENQEIRH